MSCGRPFVTAVRSSTSRRHFQHGMSQPQWRCQACLSSTTARPPRPSRSPRYHASRHRYSTSKPERNELLENNPTRSATSPTLPSHSDNQRWNASKRWSAMMDHMLARASIAGQHINVYTGTDYSAIEALRKDIIAREGEVRKQHAAVADSKEAHSQARKKQAASQKEIVGLLERKSSWSPTDLERYMALVRSEHVDDQAVQKAAEALAMSERQLEATRSLLEKLERQQYHEEQIWSDTIRRNSTWVTIGLMGINIVLLLAQISVFEPYRRRKIVNQIEQALDHRMASLPQLPDVSTPADEPLLEATSVELDGALVAEKSALEPEILPTDHDLWTRAKLVVAELFSTHAVQMRQADRTALVLESAAAGAGVALLGALIMLKAG